MRSFLTIIVFLLCFQGFGQKDTGFVLLRSFEGEIADAAIDILDNLYIISSSGQIRKYNANGDSAAIYNQVRNYGQLHSIDVSNPLRPLLFYHDFSTVVILDRFLSQRSVLDLRKFNVFQPSAAALSYDNNIWVFDEFDNKLKKMDEQGNILMSTPDFRVVFNQSLKPSRIINDNGFVYLADSINGIYVFDNYGTFRKKLPPVKWQSITVRENNVIYSTAQALILQNSVNYSEARKFIPASFHPYSHSFITPNRLLTFSKDSLKIYRF